MSKTILSFDIQTVKEPIFVYQNKYEWDFNPYSFTSYKRHWEARGGVLQIEGSVDSLAVCYSEPTSFPCIAIQGPRIRINGEPDEIVFFFLYDFSRTVIPS
jgi:hypothetical protein